MISRSDIDEGVRCENAVKRPTGQGYFKQGCVYQGSKDRENGDESPSLISPPQRHRAEIVEETEPNGASLPCPCTIRILDCSRAAASFDSLLDVITTCDFRFVCPVKWNEMADLPDGSGKHCDHCHRPVVTVHTRKEFNAAAKRGDCVAVFPEGEEELPPLSGEALPPDYAKEPKTQRRKAE